MRKIFGLFFCVLLAVQLFALPASAEIPEPDDDFYVLDQAGVLTEETKAMIVFNNDALCEACGAQIVVVTVADTGGMDIEQYALKLREAWQIGDAVKHNGILVLLAIDDDDYWVMQDRSLERTLPSGELQLMLDDDLEPDFAAKRYDAGVQKLFTSLFDKVAGIYGADLALKSGADCLSGWNASQVSAATQAPKAEKTAKPDTGRTSGREKTKESKKGSGGVKFVLIILIVVWLIGRIGRRGGRSSGGASYRTYNRPSGGYRPTRNYGSSFRTGSSWSRPSSGSSNRSWSRPSSGSSSRSWTRSSSGSSGSSRSYGSTRSSGGSRGFGGGRSGGGSTGARGGGAGRGR